MASKVIQIKLRFPDGTEQHVADTYGDLNASLWLIEFGDGIIKEHGNIEIVFIESQGSPDQALLWTPPIPDIDALEQKIAARKERKKERK